MKSILFFFITISLSAQIRGVVKDSISGEPIPYVNIWVENETIGTTSETNGSFSLDIKEEKLLVFSALGYEIKKVSSKTDLILLKPKVFELNEMEVGILREQIQYLQSSGAVKRVSNLKLLFNAVKKKVTKL